MYIIVQTSLIPTAVVSTHGDPSLADSVPGAENHVMLSLPCHAGLSTCLYHRSAMLTGMYLHAWLILNLPVLILRGHQRILYSLVILGILSAKNLS